MPIPKYSKKVHKLLDPVDASPRSGPDYIKVNRRKSNNRWAEKSYGGKYRSIQNKVKGASGADRVIEENAAREAAKRAKKNKRRVNMGDYIRGKAKTIKALKK